MMLRMALSQAVTQVVVLLIGEVALEEVGEDVGDPTTGLVGREGVVGLGSMMANLGMMVSLLTARLRFLSQSVMTLPVELRAGRRDGEDHAHRNRRLDVAVAPQIVIVPDVLIITEPGTKGDALAESMALPPPTARMKSIFSRLHTSIPS